MSAVTSFPRKFIPESKKLSVRTMLTLEEMKHVLEQPHGLAKDWMLLKGMVDEALETMDLSLKRMEAGL
ncbi:MAG: hypothetical protein HQL74_07370 [Magnetococcales bacterium]|nr:hypothetical protein [Magnetococcales bacterium]